MSDNGKPSEEEKHHRLSIGMTRIPCLTKQTNSSIFHTESFRFPCNSMFIFIIHHCIDKGQITSVKDQQQLSMMIQAIARIITRQLLSADTFNRSD